MDSGQAKVLKANPEKSANLISKLFFWFINPLLRLGFKRTLEPTDFYQVLDKDESHALCEKLEKEWKNEIVSNKQSTKAPSLRSAIYRVFGRHYMLLGLVLIYEELLKVIQPIFMGRLIRYFRYCSSVTESEAYWHAFGLSMCALMLAIWHHPYFYQVQRTGMQVRVACCGLIYKKIMTLSTGALRETEVGKVVNLLSNDVARFDQIVIFLHYFWAAPLGLIGFIILLWIEMGPSCLAGFACLVILVPIQGAIGRQMGKYRREVAGFADKRIGIMNEILNGIRVIKMYAWEMPFSKLVDDVRKLEIKKLRVQAIYQALLMGSFFASGKLIVLCAIVACILSGQAIGAERVFVASALFNSARLTVSLFLPFAFQFYAEAKVTIGRLEKFLLMEDKEELSAINAVEKNGDLPKEKDGDFHKVAIDRDPADVLVDMSHFGAKWTSSSTDVVALDDINFTVRPGKLLMIVGPVGAGKSTILHSLLGETKQVAGKVVVRGKAAYVPQQAWIFSSSVRQNVIFGGGSDFDAVRYQKAVDVCALKKDLEIFPYGDETVVGDRGVSLSGGQRARVNLARAVYSGADIFLLDDPLSAVDSAVGRFIFEKCILQHLAKSVRILVTHQLQYLKYADEVIVIREGKIVASGTFDELQKLGDHFTSILRETEESYRRQDSTPGRGGSFSSPEGKSPKHFASSKEPIIHQHSLVDDIVPEIGIEGSPRSRPKSDVFDDADLAEYDSRKTKSMSTLAQGAKSSETKSLLPVSQKKEHTIDHKLTDEENDVDGFLDHEKREVPTQIEEERTSGAVNVRVYLEYFRAMGNPFCIFLLFMFCIFVQVVFNFSDYWLNIWASTEDLKNFMLKKNTSNATDEWDEWEFGSDSGSKCLNDTLERMNRTRQNQLPLTSDDYLYIYTGLILGLMLLSLIRAVVFRLMLTRSSFTLHSRMFRAILMTPILFFDRNPVGRILNRFSKDTGLMDELLAFVTFDFIQGLIVFIGIILVVGFLNPYVFVPTVPLAVVFFFVRFYYMKSARVIKRLEATTKSPVFSHVSATLNGLTTIRAFRAEHSAIRNFHDYQNSHTAIFSAFLSTSRWFSLVIDWLCSLFVAVVAFISVWSYGDQDAGSVGLSLFYAMSLMGFFQWIIRQSTEMESMMVSVERILEYSNLPSEGAEQSVKRDLPAHWPPNGRIVFDHVSVRYSADLPYILKDVNFEIKSKYKIGLVGRTGAGKSSILNALFRLTEPEGIIKIDDIDIKSVDLRELRKRIAIIPQDPVLFIGTLRKNLDPFNEFSDDKVWSALEQVELKNVVLEYEKQLETPMQEGGANLSVGQRQLVCLARALLRRNKVLVIDEATANVDLHTDALIQRTIREQFKDCTVLTIAHRLNTIMDCDCVMVLQEGRLIEFDKPALLLRNDESLFSKLVAETGAANSKILVMLAERAHKARTGTNA